MNIVYNKEGNMRFLENSELCDIIEKTHNVKVVPALGPIGLTIEENIFECMRFTIGSFGENLITEMESIHNIDAKKEITMAAIDSFIRGRNECGGEPFSTMYAFEIHYRDSIGDDGVKMKDILFKAALR